jgi:hypothetical protein
MRIRLLLAALATMAVALVGTPVAAHAQADLGSRTCTHTSSGSCIRGGQFCPRSKYGKSGWDAHGRRYVCKGNRSHPHWMKP